MGSWTSWCQCPLSPLLPLKPSGPSLGVPTEASGPVAKGGGRPHVLACRGPGVCAPPKPARRELGVSATGQVLQGLKEAAGLLLASSGKEAVRRWPARCWGREPGEQRPCSVAPSSGPGTSSAPWSGGELCSRASLSLMSSCSNHPVWSWTSHSTTPRSPSSAKITRAIPRLSQNILQVPGLHRWAANGSSLSLKIILCAPSL